MGQATSALCDVILEGKAHQEQAHRACLGIVRLAKSFGPERVEAACRRTLDGGTRTYASVKTILEKSLDRLSSTTPATETKPILHENIRGPGYYH
jgi:transposase